MSPESAPAAGEWRAQRTEDGSWTLLHPGHGQACHSLHGAWTQARERYASLIGELPSERVANARVRLLDIGTGLGLNLAAALDACEARGWSLEATSLEVDPRVVRAAARMEPAGQSHARILAALQSAEPSSGVPQVLTLGAHRVTWVLGDAREQLPRLAEPPHFDAVFLDPFSPGVDPPLWEAEFLEEIARRMAPGARLATYTVSMRVRTALARAGLAVGAGPRVGRKAAGTLASRGGPVPPLDPRTQRRLERACAG